MIANMIKAKEILREGAKNNPYSPEFNYRWENRVEKLSKILETHPDAQVVFVRDENTGVRFGESKKNKGHCKKLGNCSYSPSYSGGIPYQVWAVWEK